MTRVRRGKFVLKEKAASKPATKKRGQKKSSGKRAHAPAEHLGRQAGLPHVPGA